MPFVCAVIALVIATVASLAAAQIIPPDVVIRLERTSCFGECPVYSVSIDAKGNVTYDGTEFVRVKGRQTDRIPVPRVAELLATADRIGFFDLRDQYRTIRNPDGTETMVTDLPTTFVTITRGGRSKRIEDYVGAPAELKQLEQQIDEAARTVRWVRVDVPTLRRLASSGQISSRAQRGEIFYQALTHDDVDVIAALLEMDADPNWDFGRKTRPLMMVRSARATRVLIEAGANPSARNDNGETPLSQAVLLAPEVTALLVTSGAKVDQLVGSDGRTALWQASCEGNAGVVKLLLDVGADPTLQPSHASAVDCARQGQESVRLQRFPDLISDRPFVQDFDRVIALLSEARDKSK